MRVPRKARGLSALPLAFLMLAACGGSNTGEHGATPSNNAAGVSALRASTAPVGPPAGTATGTSDNRPPSPPAAPISRSGASAASGTIQPVEKLAAGAAA